MNPATRFMSSVHVGEVLTRLSPSALRALCFSLTVTSYLLSCVGCSMVFCFLISVLMGCYLRSSVIAVER
uniref:Uncharacterized protein n=1 Tax=Pararge aegeria TaxID=116150 RepID=S4NPC6_9NEOP